MEKTDGEAKATGVQFIVDGATHSVKVKKEVIVCGGSVNSPQILELSGIGSPEVLQKAGVELVVANVGVGENLNDHTATALAVVSAQPTPLTRTA
jgi:choline dehydrogenase